MATTTSAPSERFTVYEPATFGIPPLGPYVRAVWQRRPLIMEMAKSKLKAEHYNTVLGQVWILLDPLLMGGVYLMLRMFIRPVGGGDDRSYIIAHLIVGIFFFSYVRKAVGGGAKSITGNKALVLNAAFPRGVFPVEATIRAFLSFLPMLVIYFFLHALLRQPFALEALVFLPVLIVLLTIFLFGCACFLAPLSVFFRDTDQFLNYVMRIWFFTTPIIFTVAEVFSKPEVPQFAKTLLKLNPLFPTFAMLEQIWTGQVPSPWYMLAAAAWAFSTLVLGVVTFLVREREFAVHL